MIHDRFSRGNVRVAGTCCAAVIGVALLALTACQPKPTDAKPKEATGVAPLQPTEQQQINQQIQMQKQQQRAQEAQRR